MTNRELLRAPQAALTAVDRQKQSALRVELTPVPCPACQAPTDALTAAGTDIDAFDFGAAGREHRCPHCQAELELVVPVLASAGPGWHWQLKHDWLADRLARAKMYDRDHPNEQEQP
jgi:hypothetical protein